MKRCNGPMFFVALVTLIFITSSPGYGQLLTGAPAAPEYKYSTPMPPGVASPDKVETRLGTLNFFGGFPDQASVDNSTTTSTSSARYRPTCSPCRS